MSRRRRWVLASSNPGKLREFREILDSGEIELVAQSEFAVPDAIEDGASFVENALIKARQAARLSGLPAIADDSGLCVDALDGRPGIRSARFAGESASDEANVERLLQLLAGRAPGERTAHFYCVIVALEHECDPAPTVCTGRWDGRICDAPRGRHGFGYDPVFVPAGSERSSAELGPAEKNRISHRGLALAELRAKLGACPH